MAVSYAPMKLRVPAGFQNLLEGLAREVLREQPADIVSFAAQYFKNKLVLREETGKDDAKRGEQLENLMKGEEVDIDPNDPSVQAAATKIQASFRGHKAREEVKKHKEEEEAAIKIQATFRGHVTREQVKEIKVSQSKEQVEQSEKEAEKVTTDAPKDDQTGEEQADEVDIDLNDPEVQGAAVKIQASFRGHKAREEVKAMKSGEHVAVQEEMDSAPEPQQDSEVQPDAQQTAAAVESSTPQGESEVIDIDLEDEEVKKAASKIQASFRSKLSRSSKDIVAKDADEGPTEDAVQVEKSEEVPVEQSQEPMEPDQQPTEVSPQPEKQYQEAAEQIQEPEEDPKEPSQQASQELAEQSQQPEEQSQEPVERSQEPSEETNEQSQEPEQQSKELEEPRQEPDELSQEPGELSQEPGELSQEPVEQSKEPEDVASEEPNAESEEPAEPRQETPSKDQETPSQEQETPSKEQEDQETTEQ